jgi:hypothetical protein
VTVALIGLQCNRGGTHTPRHRNGFNGSIEL